MVMDLMPDARVDGDTAVVTCRGPIVHGTTARRFRACVRRLLRRYRRLVVDLGAVTHIDARGVGMLALLIAQARSADRQLVLVRSSNRVERVLRLTRLDAELRNDSWGSQERAFPFNTSRPASKVRDRAVVRILRRCMRTTTWERSPRAAGAAADSPRSKGGALYRSSHEPASR
jgi:anti-anti-sigma factor